MKRKTSVIQCSGEGPSVVVYESTRWQRFKAWLKRQVFLDYPDETTSVGRGQ